MPGYTFASLSSQDFEELVRDLLQAEWDVPLEAFKTGRDGGIDLRYAPLDAGSAIIQCKHYATSGFGKLLAHLRNVEEPKVQRLAPRRYVIATSVGLTPANKDEIAKALSPFVLTTADVLGADDIAGLLSRHPDVERSNFKLWLTSTSVLDRVLHNAEHRQTEFEIDRIRRKLPLFVQNDAFPRASSLLDETRVVIISGVPGIGKTTLAEMLLYAHLERGYEPVVIQSEIAEGKRLFKPDAKRIYYYDDFLGQTFLGDRREYLGRNEDAAIVDFIEMIGQSGHCRFILTTREHILSSARQVSERLFHSPVLSRRCVLELSDYSKGQKARILYNHLYFSDLPQSYKDAILQDNFFMSIIEHAHFNPRLIEWLSSQTRLKGVTAGQYQRHITSLLASPDSIWAHAFRYQISNAARHVLISLYTLGEWIETRDLEPVFIALHRQNAEKYHQPIGPGDYRKALQELDGAFLLYSSDHASFLNPSIREFIASVISANGEVVEDILVSAVRFKQLASLWKLSEARASSDLAKFMDSNIHLFARSLTRLLGVPSMHWDKMRDGSRRGYYIDMSLEARISFLIQIAEARQSEELAAIACAAAERLTADLEHSVPEFRAVVDLLEQIHDSPWVFARGGHDMYVSLLGSVLKWLKFAQADDWLNILPFSNRMLLPGGSEEEGISSALRWYCSHGADEEREQCTTIDELYDLKESLGTLSGEFGLDLSRATRSLDDYIDERDQRYDDDDRNGYNGPATRPQQEFVSDEDIAQMFGSLREGS